MCGIIGFTGKNVTQEHLRVLQRVMIESRIRGMHASGVVWAKSGKLSSVVKAIPIDKLVEQLDFTSMLDGKSLTLAAHARYSTSDIKYNQPIIDKDLAIAHNGVISQESPKLWDKLYGYKCKTKNDSELLLKALEAGDNLYEVFPTSSIAAICIKNDGSLSYYRNGLRPLWSGKIGTGTVYASTYDILKRAGVTDIQKVPTQSGIELQRRSGITWENNLK